jgi:hypothetical protein
VLFLYFGADAKIKFRAISQNFASGEMNAKRCLETVVEVNCTKVCRHVRMKWSRTKARSIICVYVCMCAVMDVLPTKHSQRTKTTANDPVEQDEKSDFTDNTVPDLPLAEV